MKIGHSPKFGLDNRHIYRQRQLSQMLICLLPSHLFIEWLLGGVKDRRTSSLKGVRTFGAAECVMVAVEAGEELLTAMFANFHCKELLPPGIPRQRERLSIYMLGFRSLCLDTLQLYHACERNHWETACHTAAHPVNVGL